MKIGLFGGTFNPVHNGHLKIAEAAIKTLSLSKLIVILNGMPPHKRDGEILSDEHRLNMLRLAFSDMENTEISTYEISKKRLSYSIYTVKHFKKLYRDSEIFFILGEDSVQDIDSWYKSDELLSLCRFAYASRSGYKANKDFTMLKMDNYDISSSKIREMIKRGEDISPFVPPLVREYILNNNLYRQEEK